MGDEEVPAAEAPQDRDARQAGILGRLQVHIGISHIDCFLFRNAELPQSLFHHVRFGLPRDARLLAYCNVYHTLEEGSRQLVDTRLQLVADRRISFDLDDGVVVNYAKFGDVLSKIK